MSELGPNTIVPRPCRSYRPLVNFLSHFWVVRQGSRAGLDGSGNGASTANKMNNFAVLHLIVLCLGHHQNGRKEMMKCHQEREQRHLAKGQSARAKGSAAGKGNRKELLQRSFSLNGAEAFFASRAFLWPITA